MPPIWIGLDWSGLNAFMITSTFARSFIVCALQRTVIVYLYRQVLLFMSYSHTRRRLMDIQINHYSEISIWKQLIFSRFFPSRPHDYRPHWLTKYKCVYIIDFSMQKTASLFRFFYTISFFSSYFEIVLSSCSCQLEKRKKKKIQKLHDI